jgi:hypothetical protein
MTESVAYMSENGVLFKEMPPNPMFELTPLYKLRELTDEEITEEIEKMFGKIIDPEALKDELTLARAILKKASEK